MKKLITSIIVGFIAMQAIYACAKASEGTSEYSAGEVQDDKAEIIQNAVFTDLEGNEMSLKDFEGKVVLIDIWETWCAPCIVSMPTLHQLVEDYPEDFAVVALSPKIMDSPEQVEEFAASHDYEFTYVYGRQLAVDLGIQSIPHKIYVGPDGQYLTTIVGSHGPEQDYEKTKEIIEANRN